MRLALGGVAHKPWRASRPSTGFVRRRPPSTSCVWQSTPNWPPARSTAHNHFKSELARRVVVSVLAEMLGLRGAR
jgi:xanthine dehydrogenase YagS FAD-binding subunit